MEKGPLESLSHFFMALGTFLNKQAEIKEKLRNFNISSPLGYHNLAKNTKFCMSKCLRIRFKVERTIL